MNTIHDCSTELRQANLAATPARITAMQLFESHEKPIDALSLVDALSDKGVDRVTAFRIINAFVEKGLLRKLEFLEGKSRYELASRGDHHHFICRSCGTIQDIKDTIVPQFIHILQKQYSIMVIDHTMEFFGLCKNCQQ